MKGTAGQLRVPVAYLENILTPLPPIKEQKRIVSKIESIFAQIDGTRTRLEVASRMLNKLRSSVLRQAFEGKLVSAGSERRAGGSHPEEDSQGF